MRHLRQPRLVVLDSLSVPKHPFNPTTPGRTGVPLIAWSFNPYSVLGPPRNTTVDTLPRYEDEVRYTDQVLESS